MIDTSGHIGRSPYSLTKYMSLSAEVQYRRKSDEPRAQIFEQNRQILRSPTLIPQHHYQHFSPLELAWSAHWD